MPLEQPRAGRNCPTGYAYGAGVFAREPDLSAQTLYVIGGLYGNGQALDMIESLAAREAVAPQLVFNGDFHWFDTDPAIFADLHARVLRHTALRGNVETELAADDEEAGCGCGYPEDVSDDVVAHSNQIIIALRDTAQRALGELRGAMAALPASPSCMATRRRWQVGIFRASGSMIRPAARSTSSFSARPRCRCLPVRIPACRRCGVSGSRGRNAV
jgi:hypothetical protein